MERVNKILNHDLFHENLRKNEEWERDREFCRHGMGHFLDVARLAELLNLKEGRHVKTELIYAAALLHDIGRCVQYEAGTPHETAGVVYAMAILEDCGFDDKETDVILEAVRSHRRDEAAKETGLTGLLYRADKLSRSCFSCKAVEKCNRKEGKKNKKLIL